MLRLAACPSPELVEHQVLKCHCLQHGLSKSTTSTFQHFAVKWSGSAGSSRIPEGRDRGIHGQLGAFTSRHPLPLTNEILQLCAQGYALKLMEEMRPQIRSPRFHHQSGPQTPHCITCRGTHSQDRICRKGRGRRVWSFLSPFSTESRVLLENLAKTDPALLYG